MNERRVLDTVTCLVSTSIDTADRDSLATITGLNATLKAYTAYIDMRIARRANELKSTGESAGGFDTLLDGNGSARDAKAAEERDRACNTVPGFEDALAEGDVSAEHVDVLARLTKGLSDEERLEVEAASEQLLADAQRSAWDFERRLKALIADIKSRTRPNSDVEEAERQRAASSVKRWTDKASGMKMTLISLDPFRDEQLHKVIDAKLAELRQDPANARIPFEQLKVMALLAAVSAEAGAMGVAEVVIHTDAHTCCRGRHADTLCETVDGVPVPVATMQGFCCEAAITAVIVEADGTVRRLTTEPRLANRSQRRVLAAMYSTCAHPNCTVGFSKCRIHHVDWYERGGPTVVDNLLPLCEEHHHLVHEGRWNLSMTPDRTLTWMRPDGSVWLVHPSINRQPHPDRQPRRTAA
jgi:hypothetical protein